MHEFSIAQALMQLVTAKAPPGVVVRGVSVRAGPLRAIEPDAMRWAWQAAVTGSPLARCELRLTNLPWTLRCVDCGRRWQSDDPSRPCACGRSNVYPCEDATSAELTLVSIEVDEPDAPDRHAPATSPLQ